MGYKCSFLDNEIYGADDVSAVFSSLVTNGVVLYPEADTVQEALNEMTTEVVSSGVSEYGRLSVTLTDSGARVGMGTAFFDSGVSITVDGDGMDVAFEKGNAVYVYLVHQAELNVVLLKAESEITEGDTVPLVYIDADGKITDIRRYAKAKVGINTANECHKFTITHERWSININNVVAGSQTIYKMPHTGFNYMLLLDADLNGLTYYPLGHIIDLNKEGVQSLSLNESGIYTNLYAERIGDEIIITSIYKGGGTRQHNFSLALV